MAKTLSVDIWSDIACPWCYIGKRRFETALAKFAAADSVAVTWRSFELDPSAPARRDPSLSMAQRLAQKYGMSVAQAEQRLAQVVAVAAEEGLAFDFTHIQPGNTFDAHRVLHHARKQGVGNELKERFLRGYQCEGLAIGDHESLVSVAGEIGLDVDEVHGVLATDAFAAEVRADQREAQAIGVSGVPFFRLGRYGVSGAQPAELFGQALQKAWDELPEPLAGAADASVCGPDGCV